MADAPPQPSLDDVRIALAEEHGLAVVSTVQRDGRVLSSVVNCGVLMDPTTGMAVVGFVSGGSAARLDHLRRGSELTMVVRRGWKWLSVTGPTRIVGPGDVEAGFDDEQLRLLLRDVFQAAGGTHDDWDEYDRVMAQDERACVFVRPDRILGNY